MGTGRARRTAGRPSSTLRSLRADSALRTGKPDGPLYTLWAGRALGACWASRPRNTLWPLRPRLRKRHSREGYGTAETKNKGFHFSSPACRYKNIFFAIYFKMKNSESIKFKILYTIN